MATPTATANRKRLDSLEQGYSTLATDTNLSAVDVFRRAIGVPDPWQVEMCTAPGDLLVNCSRQSGKSTTMGAIGCAELLKPHTLTLCLGPAERQSKELLYKIISAYTELGQPLGRPIGQGQTYLSLSNGSRALALPAKESNIRGFSAHLLLLDEAAMIPDPLFYALRPMVSTTGGRTIAASTPKGKRGWWYHRIEVLKGGKAGGATYFEVPAPQISRIPVDFLLEEKASIPDPVFQQEYMCSFEADAYALFDPELLAAAISEDLETWEFGERKERH